MAHLGIRPNTLRRYKNIKFQKKVIQTRNVETTIKPCFNMQKPNEESFLIRKLLRKEEELKALKDLEWILTEVLENC